MSTQVDHGRGKIRHNAVAAMVTSKLFRVQAVKPKKGKGTYARKAKHQSRDLRL
jgi:alternative ribosome-rescue factor